MAPQVLLNLLLPSLKPGVFSVQRKDKTEGGLQQNSLRGGRSTDMAFLWLKLLPFSSLLKLGGAEEKGAMDDAIKEDTRNSMIIRFHSCYVPFQ